MSEETKGALKSKSMWGIALLVLSSYFPQLGLTGEDSWVQDIAILLGGGLAGYGRVKASTKIKGVI